MHKTQLVSWLIFALLLVAAVIIASALHFYRGEPPDVLSAIIETPVSLFWASFILVVGGIIGEVSILSQLPNGPTIKETQLKKYRDLVGFDRKIQLEKIVHLLYYITTIAGIRKDMTAKVIASRLAGLRELDAYGDRQIHENHQTAIFKEMRDNSDAVVKGKSPTFVEIPENTCVAIPQRHPAGPVTPFKRTWNKKDPANIDREHAEIAYALHESVTERLDREADKFWAKFLRDLNPFTTNERILFYSFLCLLVLGALAILGGLIHTIALTYHGSDMRKRCE